ncbi:MAG: ABC transporter substrate-binding protein [Deltaproteobacteria bacterium]|nr:ABC transporter substrate-binding protein [Deltaproteobacteria bacterium]MBI2179805.1 ABC transporter substrate-binding protein [Deltaproteobacteria bacterium]MBI3065511.1 ABC transporter substrate-binding protein [Deltaproteobacteria bacterium]
MKKQCLRTLILLLWAIVTISLANPRAAAQTAMEKLRVAYTVIAPTQLNVWTAKEMGYYAKHGLDVELVLLVGAPLAVAALVGGETPIVHTGASAVITSNLAGSGAVLIAGAINRFPYVLFVTEQIKRVEDLRGKRFAVSRIGGADNAAAVTVLDRLGVKESEITYVQAGSIPARLAAMQTNAMQATLLQAPETLKAKEIGLRALLDFTKLDVEWQQNGVAVTRDYIQKKPDTVRRFMRAYVEAIHYNLTNPRGAQKILQKYLAIKDVKMVEEAYNEIVAKLTRRVPYPTEPGIQLYLDQLKLKNPKAGQAKPADFTDISYLKELESSGYIDKLYK